MPRQTSIYLSHGGQGHALDHWFIVEPRNDPEQAVASLREAGRIVRKVRVGTADPAPLNQQPTDAVMRELARLSVCGDRGVPVNGADLAHAHSEQVRSFSRTATDDLREVWNVIDAGTYEEKVTVLTKYYGIVRAWLQRPLNL